MPNDKTAKVRELNDRLRKTFIGGKVVITPGIQALPAVDQSLILMAVMQFNDFTEDNDPHQEHDMAILEVRSANKAATYRIMYKIDYCDLEMRFHSPDKSCETVTNRVLTILMASEY